MPAVGLGDARGIGDPNTMAPGATHNSRDGVDQLVHRLQELVERETAELRSRAPIDLQDYNVRKNRVLLELSRALRGFDIDQVDATFLARIATLRTKLNANRSVLETHIEAAREVSTVLADAVQEAESDGTYSRSAQYGRAW